MGLFISMRASWLPSLSFAFSFRLSLSFSLTTSFVPIVANTTLATVFASLSLFHPTIVLRSPFQFLSLHGSFASPLLALLFISPH